MPCFVKECKSVFAQLMGSTIQKIDVFQCHSLQDILQMQTKKNLIKVTRLCVSTCISPSFLN